MNYLEKLLIDHDESIRGFASKMNLSPDFVNSLRLGKTKITDMELLIKISLYFKLNPEETEELIKNIFEKGNKN